MLNAECTRISRQDPPDGRVWDSGEKRRVEAENGRNFLQAIRKRDSSFFTLTGSRLPRSAMISIANTSTSPFDNASNANTQPETKFAKKFWMGARSQQAPNVLDPDDSLMKRFQDALREHLVRVDNKLNSEISELEAQIKSVERKHEAEALQLYYSQQDVAQQQTTIEKYQSMIANVISLREQKDTRVEEAKSLRKTVRGKLVDEKKKEESLAHELEQFIALQMHLTEWQTKLENSLVISKRVSKKDKVVQRDLIAQKQQTDCIIFKLMEEVWKIKTEIANLDMQLQLKNKEKIEINQMVTDVNADLEALHRQHANLYNAWNSILLNITKRNKVYEQLCAERESIFESSSILNAETERLRKDTHKEMENNENLTTLHLRIENNIQINSRLLVTDNDKLDSLQSELVKIGKFSEQEQHEYDLFYSELQHLLREEEETDKEFAKSLNKQNDLENTMYNKLDDKVAHDKAARYLNKLLLNFKETIQEQELLLAETENSYGKRLLELEQLNSSISHEETDLEELLRDNATRGKEIDEIQKEIKRHETMIDRKRVKVIAFNKTIEEMLSHTGGEEVNPLDMKIITLEKNLEETQQKNQKAQQFWIRQEGHMITLSQQRNLQLQELNLLNKEIMIMDQKNLKIQHTLEVLEKEEANMERILNLLQHRLVQMNAQLVAQKGLKEELEDKNSITKNEGMQSLEDAELNLIKLQNDLKQLHEEKALLKGNVDAAQRESLSWEKKVQLMQETIKKLRDERGDGGDIATMKNEIHKMEMRLLHLRRAQEKLIHDMEFCVARRDIILDKVMSKFKKDPKGQHNQKVIFRKRLADQKLKIKQIMKDTKEIDNRILELESETRDTLAKCNESEAARKTIENIVPDVDQGIVQTEALKYHNLQALVFKQRKAKMLQDIKNGRYKMMFKNESALSEEFQNEQILHNYLKHVMERTSQDFPLLKNNIQRILFTLEI